MTASAASVVERIRLGAYGWAERDGHVLLCRIAPTEGGAGRWTLPGGGLQFAEEPEAGLVREVREETGLIAIAGELLGVRSAILEPDQTRSGHRIQAVGLLFRLEATDGDLVAEEGESTDLAAWVPFDELDALPSVPLLRWARTITGR